MSEPIPESVPTSSDPRSKRPTKKRALTPLSQQASQVTALFAKPDKEIVIPPSTSTALTTSTRGLPPPPEIVANVQGSSAGAGSGEFHVYKASRRREYERLKLMDEEVKREEADERFEREREEKTRRDEEKTAKNRARREKKKEKRGGKGGGGAEDGENTKAVGKPKIRVQGLPMDWAAGDGEDKMDGVAVTPVVEDVGVVIHDDND
ncbi:MAG: hypothetical protein MMC33_002517 [Icmadophila ericetorum]|nr:hypothetical protein [Icmadophila ericetorum]